MIFNIAINFISKFWNLISLIIFTPIYIDKLGFKAYGIISLSIVFQGVMSIADAGLTPLITRDLASNVDSKQKKKQILNSFELIYVSLLSLIIILSLLFSRNIVAVFFNHQFENVENFSLIIKIFTIDICSQLLMRFYIGGLQGLECHLTANINYILWGIFRSACVLVVLHYFNGLLYFFLWQAFMSVIFLIILKISIYAKLGGGRAKFVYNKDIFSGIFKSSTLLIGIAIVTGLNAQMDKLFISKRNTVEVIGQYNLASSLSSIVVSLSFVFLVVFLPRFIIFKTKLSSVKFRDLYLISTIVVALFSFTLGANIISDRVQLISNWLHNENNSLEIIKFLSVLTLSFLFMAQTVVPYALALAFGFLKIQLVLGIFSLVLGFLLYWVFNHFLNSMGIAISYLIIQIVFSLVYIYIVNKEFLKFKYGFYVINLILIPGLMAFILSYLIHISMLNFVFESHLGFYVFFIFKNIFSLLINCFFQYFYFLKILKIDLLRLFSKYFK